MMKKVRIEKAVGILLGHGGFCLNCDPCHFPVCPFEKG